MGESKPCPHFCFLVWSLNGIMTVGFKLVQFTGSKQYGWAAIWSRTWLAAGLLTSLPFGTFSLLWWCQVGRAGTRLSPGAACMRSGPLSFHLWREEFEIVGNVKTKKQPLLKTHVLGKVAFAYPSPWWHLPVEILHPHFLYPSLPT